MSDRQKKWDLNNPDKIREYKRKYAEENPEKRKESLQKYYQTHKDEYKAKYKVLNEQLKAKFLDMYGGKCNCLGCNESNPKFLTLDHINNDGNLCRGKNVYTKYRDAVNNYNPEKYQILCFNCNSGRQYNKYICPHESMSDSKLPLRKLKERFLEMYGSKCQCCGESNKGFLTMEHINGGGNKLRKNGGGTLAEYKKAIEKYNPDEYAVLCLNCNCATHINGGTCPHRGDC